MVCIVVVVDDDLLEKVGIVDVVDDGINGVVVDGVDEFV